MVSMFLSFIIIFNAGIVNVYATENLKTQRYIQYKTNEKYLKELYEMGLVDSEIEKLEEINFKLGNASSIYEVDRLMMEYHAIIDDSIYDGGASIWSEKGGTVYLDYTGNVNPMTNVIYTKVVYFSKDQVSTYQRAMNNPGFIEFINELGVSIVTEKAAEAIAIYLGLSMSKVRWLIGFSVGLFVYFIKNIKIIDFNDAYDRSTTGKLKLEFFYSTSMVFPYYMNHENFEPWNSNYIDIPQNYDFDWDPGVYDY